MWPKGSLKCALLRGSTVLLHLRVLERARDFSKPLELRPQAPASFLEEDREKETFSRVSVNFGPSSWANLALNGQWFSVDSADCFSANCPNLARF